MLRFATHGFWLRLTLAPILAASAAGSADGQAVGGRPPAQAPPEKGQAAGALKDARGGYVKATEEYVESLRELLALREKGFERESAWVERLRRLYAGGLVSRRELEDSEGSLAEGSARIKEVRLQLEGAEHFLAEALVEDDAPEAASARPLRAASRGVVLKTALVRFEGSGNWLLSDAVRVEGFFAERFGRRLPVSAYGQSDLHTRWGFDHRNSLDVGLHPDSPEGQALVAYLRSAGIPFIAFRSAVPGSATGPHIHVGRPSHRMRAQ